MTSERVVVAPAVETPAVSPFQQEHMNAVDALAKKVPAGQAGVANALARFAKDDMDSSGQLPDSRASVLEHTFDARVENSTLAPLDKLALEAMGRELFLTNAAGLQQSMEKIRALDAPGTHATSQRLFEEFRKEILALPAAGVSQLAPHILVAQGGKDLEVDDSDVVIARPRSRVPAANGLIVIAADGDVRAHVGGGGTVVLAGSDTKVKGQDGAMELPAGSHIYKKGLSVKTP